MLTAIKLFNERGESMELSLEDFSAGYLIKDVTGLDPVKASISTSKYANRDGAQLQGARRDERNIVLTIGLITDYVTNTVASLRQKIYPFVTPKSIIRMQFVVEDMPLITISGVVESCEAALFTETPSMSVSILCQDTDFSDVDQTTLTFASNSTSTTTPYLYDGSSDTGFSLEFKTTRALSGFTFYHTSSIGDSSVFPVTLAIPLNATIRLDTFPGNKGIYMNNASVLYAASIDARWPQLTPGENYFRLHIAGAAISYTVKFRDNYVGL